MDRNEVLALADKIDYAIRTEGKITLFDKHGEWASAALRSAARSQSDNARDALEKAAQALANDVWHPPIPLNKMSAFAANRFRRQAQLVLDAVATPNTGQRQDGAEPVAWRYSGKIGWGEGKDRVWRVVAYMKSKEDFFETPDKWDVEPLYTLTQSSAASGSSGAK